MNMQLDPHVKAVFDDIDANTPDIGPTPSGDVVHLHPGRSPQGRRWLAVAAAAIVVVGVGALVAIQRSDAETPDVAPATQPPFTRRGNRRCSAWRDDAVRPAPRNPRERCRDRGLRAGLRSRYRQHRRGTGSSVGTPPRWISPNCTRTSK